MINERLILFDIDGTILKTDPSARRALSDAISNFTNNPVDLTVEDCAGKTDRLIVSNSLKKFNIPFDNEKMHIILNDYFRLLQDSYRHDRSELYSGVVELLNDINDDNTNLLGLLTGNFKKGAEIKLSSFNIMHFFKVGAFGDDGFLREELPAAAVLRAKELTGKSFNNRNVIVIGDTADDVKCGKVINAKTIAVCRKKEFLDSIKNSKPDFLFFNTENHKDILKAIYS
ncbi:HAD family hydrolase [candidate division KSB1 bacterium]